MKRAKHAKKRSKFLLFLIFISIVFIFYSLFNIAMWILDSYNIKKEANQINKDVIIKEIASAEVLDEEIMVDERELLDSDPYWSLKSMDYLEVDFSNLVNLNKETVAWISVPNTNINYPIVQHSDNEYYLNHSFNGSKNDSGWLFMDYRNSIQSLGKNTIVYAHTRKDGTMFGTLEKVLSNTWCQNKDNYAINVSTKYENNLWQVFSVYCIPTTSDYIQTNFSEDVSFEKFLTKIKGRSIYDFGTTVSINDKVLTLSTCHNRDERIVLHAKLIKSQKRDNK